jgi:hypothetical protein
MLCRYTVFLFLSLLNIIHLLDLESVFFDSKYLYSRITLDMFYVLLIVFICGFMERK